MMPGFFDQYSYNARCAELRKTKALIEYQQDETEQDFIETIDQYNDTNPNCCACCCGFYPSPEATPAELQQSLNCYEDCNEDAYNVGTCAASLGAGAGVLGAVGAGCWACCACCCGCTSLSLLAKCLSAFSGAGLFLGGLIAVGINCNRSNEEKNNRINQFLPVFQKLSREHQRLSIAHDKLSDEFKAIYQGTERQRQKAINMTLPPNFHADLFPIIHEYQQGSPNNQYATPDMPTMSL